MVLPLYNSPFTHVPPRSCTLLPADAGGTFVNGPGKTNATRRWRLFFPQGRYIIGAISFNIVPANFSHNGA